jgi:hypothetical protein
MDALKDFNSYLDGLLNQTSLSYERITEWSIKNSIPTLKFWYEIFPRDLKNDTLATFIVQPTSLGWFGGYGKPWPNDFYLFSFENDTRMASVGGEYKKFWSIDRVGLNFTRRLMEELNKTRPDILYPLFFREDGYKDVVVYIKKLFNFNKSIGCQHGSTLAVKCYRSFGDIAIPFFFFRECEEGYVLGHYACVVIPESARIKMKKKIIWSFPLIESSLDLYYPGLDPRAFLDYFSRFGDRLLGLYVLDASRERNPFVVLYDYRG